MDRLKQLKQRLSEQHFRKQFAILLGGKMLGVAALLGLVKVGSTLLGGAASAAGMTSLQTAVKATDIVNPLNTLWVLVAAFLVFFMQAGFMALEVGFARSRETVNILLECVFDSGANPCPPTIVGIGLGGTSDVAAAQAKEASCFRKVGTKNADPLVAELEKELLDLINQTGIGPQGLGGVTTAMAVNIEWAHTHISQLPVAVNMQCWRGERACATIDQDGNVTFSN